MSYTRVCIYPTAYYSKVKTNGKKKKPNCAPTNIVIIYQRETIVPKQIPYPSEMRAAKTPVVL